MLFIKRILIEGKEGKKKASYKIRENHLLTNDIISKGLVTTICKDSYKILRKVQTAQ